jgi:hypothetical protein
MDQFSLPEDTVSSATHQTWSNFLRQIETSRNRIPKPALLDPRHPSGPTGADLGDGFLQGFRRERGLNRKLRVLAEYKLKLKGTLDWYQTLDAVQQQVLRPSLSALKSEVLEAENILVDQIGGDLVRGGRALQVTVRHVTRTGLVEKAAEAAFGGLTQGLKRELVNLASSGRLNEATRAFQADQIRLLERVVSGD